MKRAWPIVFIVATLLLAGGLSGVANAAGSSRASTVRINPFAQPLRVPPVVARAGVTAPSVSNTRAEQLTLRGVLQSGADSFANVNGVIVGLGERVADMRLKSVTGSSAVFERGGKTVTLDVSPGSAAVPEEPPSAAAVPERALAGSTARELDQ